MIAKQFSAMNVRVGIQNPIKTQIRQPTSVFNRFNVAVPWCHGACEPSVRTIAVASARAPGNVLDRSGVQHGEIEARAHGEQRGGLAVVSCGHRCCGRVCVPIGNRLVTDWYCSQ